MPLNTIGLTIAAHQKRHFSIIKERYIPLDNRQSLGRPAKEL